MCLMSPTSSFDFAQDEVFEGRAPDDALMQSDVETCARAKQSEFHHHARSLTVRCSIRFSNVPWTRRCT